MVREYTYSVPGLVYRRVLRLLDTLNVAVSAATVYHYTITHYGQPAELLHINWYSYQ